MLWETFQLKILSCGLRSTLLLIWKSTVLLFWRQTVQLIWRVFWESHHFLPARCRGILAVLSRLPLDSALSAAADRRIRRHSADLLPRAGAPGPPPAGRPSAGQPSAERPKLFGPGKNGPSQVLVVTLTKSL